MNSNGRQVAAPWPILRMAFRPLFWLGALFSSISILLWVLNYSGHIAFMPYGGGHFWHVHEMLFGFAVAIITGFLLTAVQNWTGRISVRGKSLGILVLVWIVGRIFMALPAMVNDVLIMVVDVIYLPLAAFFFAKPVIQARLWRNLFFVPILLLMALLNLLMHLSMQSYINLSYIHLSHVMVLMIGLVMCIMGGRVFPMFTANGTQTAKVANIVWLDRASIGLIVAAVVVELQILALPIQLQAGVLFLAGIVNFARALRWRIWVTLRTPLVWSLHLSYWALCLGLIMVAAAKIEWLSQISLAYHVITVGGMGLMILSMISRVSLGHTGRMIVVGKVMTVAFLAVLLAMFVRAILPLVVSNYTWLVVVSGLLWTLAYACFVLAYAKIVFKARVDNPLG